jgi:hypothetical protein
LAPSGPVEVRRVDLNGRADALESWIPGGTIERFVWGSRLEEHRFVTEKPIAAYERCFSIHGTRVTRGGGLTPISAEDCPVVVATLPVFTALAAPPLPCRRPLLPLLDGAQEGQLEVVGHYDPWASGLVPPGGPTNLLICFADGPWAEAAKALDKALDATRKPDAAVVVVGVLRAGELGQAAEPPLDGDVTLLLTEDSAGSWAAAFGISKPPATVLIGPDGDVRWKDEAALDPVKLGKVLDEQLESGGEVSWTPLRLAVAASDPAPDAPLRLGEGRDLALRRLRGRSVVLSFWTSCSEPSVEQLRQLREALESGAEGSTPRVRDRGRRKPETGHGARQPGAASLPAHSRPRAADRPPLRRLLLAGHRAGGPRRKGRGSRPRVGSRGEPLRAAPWPAPV